jgi:hypothetical protein
MSVSVLCRLQLAQWPACVSSAARFSCSPLCCGRGSLREVVQQETSAVRSNKYNLTLPNPTISTHFRANTVATGPVWSDKELTDVNGSTFVPESTQDKIAKYTVDAWIAIVDRISGYHMPENYIDKQSVWLAKMYLTECFLGNSGLYGAMVAHSKSVFSQPAELGNVSRQLSEADNQRAAFRTVLQLRNPNLVVKVLTVMSQLVDAVFVVPCQAVAPRFSARVMGYMYEDALSLYTRVLRELEDGDLKSLQNKPAPIIAVQYWRMKSGATVNDAILAMRADKNHQMIINHTIASLKKTKVD